MFPALPMDIYDLFWRVSFILNWRWEILNKKEKWEAYRNMQRNVKEFLDNNPICSQEEMNKFHRILELKVDDYDVAPLHTLQEEEISSSGYVLHSLEASLWCFLNSENYPEAVLKAVNLGEKIPTQPEPSQAELPEYITVLRVFQKSGLMFWRERMILRNCVKN